MEETIWDKTYEFWESDYFIDFLHWIVDSEKPEGSNAQEILHVVEKPWKYVEYWEEYTNKFHKGYFYV